MTHIRTTHVGSLPRSQEVTDFLFSKEKNQAYNATHFDEVMKKHVDLLVSRQKDCGIDIVSDGETSKISYATYVKDRYTGFSGDSPRNAPADLIMFPTFLQRLADSGGTPEYTRPMCTGEVKPLSNSELKKDISNLKSAIKKYGNIHGFMNAASPGVISLFLQNNFYPNRETYLHALADALKAEYQLIVESGLDLQIDCPDLALSRHMLFNDLSDKEFIKIANSHVEALNYALEGINPKNVRVHICWGNYEGPHICDISMDSMFSTFMSVNANYLLFETSNPRHAHEWTIFENRKSEIPEDKILIPGVIDSTTNFVEHPEVVKNRILTFSKVIDAEQLLAGTDCGFSTFAGFGNVDENIVYKKLESLVRGAELASKVI